MSIGTNSKYPRLGIRSDVTSTYLDDVIGNVKNDLNTLEQQIASAAIGTTNAETTAARPYHTSLNNRLDTIGKGQASFIEGFAVSAQSSPDMTVQVALGEGTIDGIEVEKTGTTNTATITAPVTNPRWDVVYINNTNTIGVATGSESANPVYPNIATTQKPLALIYLTAATTTITNSIITDCRSWGAYYHQDGQYKWKWKGQDAIDDLDDTIGGEIKLIGNFYENLDLSGKNNVVLNGYEANVYRISSTNSCIMSVNTVTNETTGNKIYGFKCYGNSKAGSLPLYEFDYTDEFVIRDCYGDGNSSSSATGKDIEVNNCDNFNIESDNLSSYDFGTDNFDAVIKITNADRFPLYVVNTGSVILYDLGDATTSSTSYVLLKNVDVDNFLGSFTVSFTLSRGGAAGTAYARIYIDGSPVGTERTTTGSDPFTENIEVKYGQSLEVYGKASSGTVICALNDVEVKTNRKYLF